MDRLTSSILVTVCHRWIRPWTSWLHHKRLPQLPSSSREAYAHSFVFPACLGIWKSGNSLFNCGHLLSASYLYSHRSWPSWSSSNSSTSSDSGTVMLLLLCSGILQIYKYSCLMMLRSKLVPSQFSLGLPWGCSLIGNQDHHIWSYQGDACRGQSPYRIQMAKHPAEMLASLQPHLQITIAF